MSHLIGVEVIKNFLKKRKERIERRKALKDELKSMILNESSDRKRIKFMNSHNNLEYRSANFLMNQSSKNEESCSEITIINGNES